MNAQVFCYRVWMKDGYMIMVNASDPNEAKRIASEKSAAACKGAVMSASERRKALTVDYFERLN